MAFMAVPHRGTMYRRLQEFDAAVEDLLKALDMMSESQERTVQQAQRQLLLTYNDFAVHCYLQGAYQEGVLLLNKALKDEQQEKGLYINRGGEQGAACPPRAWAGSVGESLRALGTHSAKCCLRQTGYSLFKTLRTRLGKGAPRPGKTLAAGTLHPPTGVGVGEFTATGLGIPRRVQQAGLGLLGTGVGGTLSPCIPPRALDCFFQLGNLLFAEADYQQALALSPQDEGANLRMGLLQEKMGFCEQRGRYVLRAVPGAGGWGWGLARSCLLGPLGPS